MAGSGALGDLGAHIIDLGRFLVGEVKSVSAMTQTFITERPWADGTMGKVDVDDAFAAAVEFENGAIGTLEATRFAAGRKNYQVLEINGEKGTHPLQPRAHERAGGLLDRRRAQRDAGLPQRAGHRALPSLVGATGGRRGTSSAGSTPSSTRSPTCWTASSTTRPSRPTAPPSRTATAPRSSATRSSHRQLQEAGRRQVLTAHSEVTARRSGVGFGRAKSHRLFFFVGWENKRC